jgi:hypothetical protein
VRDDYVFIRRNVSSEQMFDIAFNVTWISLLTSRIFYLVLHPFQQENIFFSFFSLNANDYSLLGLILGAVGGIYIIVKYKKLPIQRLYDFFSVAFVACIPVGFLSYMFFFQEYVLLLYFMNTMLYAFFAYYFIKYFYPKLSVFLFFFSTVSLIDTLILLWLQKKSFITVDTVLFVILIIISIVLFIFNRGRKIAISRKAQ